MKNYFGLRKTAKVSESLHQRLNLYTISAGAAGVGLLALSQIAEAKIVYTPARFQFSQNTSYSLDLNHDGTTDFVISEIFRTVTSGSSRWLKVSGSATNKIEGVIGAHSFLAVDLPAGAHLPSKRFSGKATLARECDGFIGSCSKTISNRGYWFNVSDHYLGVKFKIDGETHYGWVRMSVKYVKFILTATLTGYAYETVPNEGIIAGRMKNLDDDSVDAPDASSIVPFPQASTLGVLALGSPGLSIWRREESLGATP